jgi:hypothetical protein
MRSQALKYALILACGGAPVVSACAADVVGVVKTVKGAVHIERGGVSFDVAVGSEVYNGDRVVTGPESSVGITLRDNTLLSEGAGSSLEIAKFEFDTRTHDGALDATIKRGSLAVVNGQLAKANPDAVHYSTPTTTLGVRGTEFIIEVGGEGEGAH